MSEIEPSGAYVDYLQSARRLQDAVASVDPESTGLAPFTERMGELARALEASPGYQDGPALVRVRAPMPFSVPFSVVESQEDRLVASVRFHRHHHGANGAAHGGAVPLPFDELLGGLSNRPGQPRFRTAFLNVNYRAITPIETELRAEATLDRVEGRKRFASGRLYHGNTLLADATGLFVVLREGQD
jgi:acyl-coenzyme A thioesterase PaaI-like protein